MGSFLPCQPHFKANLSQNHLTVSTKLQQIYQYNFNKERWIGLGMLEIVDWKMSKMYGDDRW